MEFSLKYSPLDNFIFEDEEDILKDEEYEENIEPSFFSENEIPELQLNENKNSPQVNLIDSYKFGEFQIVKQNLSGNVNEKSIFLSRKKIRPKTKNNIVNNNKQNFFKFNNQKLNERLLNNIINNNENLDIFDENQLEEKKTKNLFNEPNQNQEYDYINYINNNQKKETKINNNNYINNKNSSINYFNIQNNIFNTLSKEKDDALRIPSFSNIPFFDLNPSKHIPNTINNFIEINKMIMDVTI